MNTLFDDIKAAGIPFASHESDLYIPATPAACEILRRYPLNAKTAQPFTNQAPPHKGERWLDIPFAYLPFWEARLNHG